MSVVTAVIRWMRRGRRGGGTRVQILLFVCRNGGTSTSTSNCCSCREKEREQGLGGRSHGLYVLVCTHHGGGASVFLVAAACMLPPRPPPPPPPPPLPPDPPVRPAACRAVVVFRFLRLASCCARSVVFLPRPDPDLVSSYARSLARSVGRSPRIGWCRVGSDRCRFVLCCVSRCRRAGPSWLHAPNAARPSRRCRCRCRCRGQPRWQPRGRRNRSRPPAYRTNFRGVHWGGGGMHACTHVCSCVRSAAKLGFCAWCEASVCACMRAGVPAIVPCPGSGDERTGACRASVPCIPQKPARRLVPRR